MKFRKKPVEIEARRYDPNLNLLESLEVINWAGGIIDDDGVPVIRTLEGPHFVSPGDWVIRGVQGEFYPCKPDIFEQTYEAVTE